MTISKGELLLFFTIVVGGALALYYGIEPMGCSFVKESRGSIAYVMGCGR